MLTLLGGDTGSMFMSADNAVTSCVVKSVVHPAYLVMNSTSVNFNTELSTELPIAADVSDTSVTLPVDSDASLTCVGGDVVEMPLTVAADVSEVSILTCDHSDVDMHLTETDQLSTHNVVMHLDDIGATNIVLQYSDIVEDAGHMVLTSLNDHCYEIADDANHSIATVLYDDSCVE